MSTNENAPQWGDPIDPKAERYDPIPETVTQALAIWDSGGAVFSVEMGGLGPGYEMAIQGLAFEIMRHILAQPIDWPRLDMQDDAYMEEVKARLDRVVHECNSLPWGGFSGAQVGQAKNIACAVARRGYRAALRDPIIKDRLIQVSKKDLRSAR